MIICVLLLSRAFQSTPSKRKETIQLFIRTVNYTFQSTPSKRKETTFLFAFQVYSHVSIHSFQAEGDYLSTYDRHHTDVSIHSFQAEGDSNDTVYVPFLKCFNPLLPSGRRHRGNYFRESREVFQSTPSKRKETLYCKKRMYASVFQSTPSKRKETKYKYQRACG